MGRTALVQRNSSDTDWWSESCLEAAMGFKRLGYKVVGFTTDELEYITLAKNRPIRGSLQNVRRALHLLGVPQPKNVDIPRALKPFAGREIWSSTLGDVRKRNNRVFIKPLEIQKGFVGHVFRRKGDFPSVGSIQASLLPGDFKVLCQEVVQWIVEWRVFILRGKIMGTYSYSNRAMLNGLSYAEYYGLKPNYHTVRKMIDAFGKDAPAGYCLDVGIMLGSKETFLVEMNDGFSMGNYGLRPIDYARITEARWDELVKRKR